MANPKDLESQIIKTMHSYRHEAEEARRSRMAQNKLNYQMYHLKQDFSQKRQGQSREVLPKFSMGVEQSSSFIQQGLADQGEWFKVEAENGVDLDQLKVKPHEISKILERHLEHCDFMNLVGDATKLGIIGSLMIAKVHGCYEQKPSYVAKTEMKSGSFKKVLIREMDYKWKLKIELLRQEDYFPDPTGRGLYEMQDSYVDYYELLQDSQGDDAIYDIEAVQQLKSSQYHEKAEREAERANETGQNIANSSYRKKIKLTEIWGTILGDDGSVLYDNVVCTIANDRVVVRKPTPNPFWHKRSPFVVSPILRVPHSVWHRALGDAPVELNKAINEMFNLMLDGGLYAVHGIKQIRPDWLEDPTEVENGISPGDTLQASPITPPGAKILERIDTSAVPPDTLQVLNIINQEFNSAMLTSDIRMGVQSFRQVKATEIVESNNVITSMFSGIAKSLEEKFITQILQKSWQVIAQHLTALDEAELASLITKKRASELRAMGSEEVFADTVNGCKFRVFGISRTLNKQKDFTKLTSLLQTIGSSEILMEEYVKQGNSFGKLLDEIMGSLDIDVHKLKESQQDLGVGIQGGPDVQSQIPQAGASVNQGDMNPIPNQEFPGSPATKGGIN